MKIALLSKWHVHAGGYGNDFKALPFVEVAVVWDNDPARGKAWADELGVAFEPDLDKVLSRADIDAVSVGTATTIHEQVIVAAAKAGKAIFTEKVLAVTTAEAERIAAAVNENDVKFLIALRRRTEGRIRFAKQLVDQGKIGKLTHLHVRDAHDGVSSGWLPDTFFDLSQCGGGAMMDLGAHPMYLSLYFMPNPISVSSTFTDKAGKGVDDNCVSVIEYADGGIAVSETAFVSGRCPFSIQLDGTQGSILIVDGLDGILLSDADGRRLVQSEVADTAAPTELFARAVEYGEPIEFGIDSAVALTKLMEAAYKSAATHQPAAI